MDFMQETGCAETPMPINRNDYAEQRRRLALCSHRVQLS